MSSAAPLMTTQPLLFVTKEHTRQCVKSFAHGLMDGSDLSEMSINRLTSAAGVFNFERGFRPRYMGDPRGAWQTHKAEGT